MRRRGVVHEVRPYLLRLQPLYSRRHDLPVSQDRRQRWVSDGWSPHCSLSSNGWSSHCCLFFLQIVAIVSCACTSFFIFFCLIVRCVGACCLFLFACGGQANACMHVPASVTSLPTVDTLIMTSRPVVRCRLCAVYPDCRNFFRAAILGQHVLSFR